MQGLRLGSSLLLLVRFALEAAVAIRASPKTSDLMFAALRVVGCAIVLLAYWLFPYHRVPRRFFHRYVGEQSSTDGVRYSDVAATKGQRVDVYKCPALGPDRKLSAKQLEESFIRNAPSSWTRCTAEASPNSTVGPTGEDAGLSQASQV